ESRRLQVWTSWGPKRTPSRVYARSAKRSICRKGRVRQTLIAQIGSPGSGGSPAVEIRPAHAFKIEEFAGRIDFPVFRERKGILLQVRTERSFQFRLSSGKFVHGKQDVRMMGSVCKRIGIERREIARQFDVHRAQHVSAVKRPHPPVGEPWNGGVRVVEVYRQRHYVIPHRK